MKLKHLDPAPFHRDYGGEMNRCAICNRRLPRAHKWIEVVGGGLLWDVRAHGPADDRDRGYMGCYPVGSDCARRLDPGLTDLRVVNV